MLRSSIECERKSRKRCLENVADLNHTVVRKSSHDVNHRTNRQKEQVMARGLFRERFLMESLQEIQSFSL